MEGEFKRRLSKDQSSLGILIQKAFGQSYMSKTLKAISILREVSKELIQSEQNAPLSVKIDEVINILGNEEEDEISKSHDGIHSEDLEDTLTFLKTFSNSYTRDLKTSDLESITKKFTVNKIPKAKPDPDKEPVQRDRSKGNSFKRFDNVIKIKEKLTGIDNFNFNLFDLESLLKEKTLDVLSHYMFEKLDYFELGYFENQTFRAFTHEISTGYLKVPYHSSMHACDVLQTTYMLLVVSQLYEVRMLAS